MSYVNGTAHYNLPQTVGTDKRDWSDTNQAFADLDAAVYGAVSDVATEGVEVESLKTRMTAAEEQVTTNTSNIAALDVRATTMEGAVASQGAQITDVKQDAQDMICAFNEASATSTHAYAVGDYFIYNDVLYRATEVIDIGDTIVPDSNCTTTNVTTEIKSVKNEISTMEKIIYPLPNSANVPFSSLIPRIVEYLDNYPRLRILSALIFIGNRAMRVIRFDKYNVEKQFEATMTFYNSDDNLTTIAFTNTPNIEAGQYVTTPSGTTYRDISNESTVLGVEIYI